MNTSHPFLILCAFSLSCACGGCLTIYGYRDVEVTVTDAETGEPVPGATVTVGYIKGMLDLNTPKPSSGTTGATGLARVRVAKLDSRTGLTAEGPGYLQGHLRRFDDTIGKPQVALYRAPEARLVIVLPVGYRGLVKVERVPVPQAVPVTPGKRELRFTLGAGALIRIEATPLIEDHIWRDFQFEDFEGRRIPIDARHTPAGPDDVVPRLVTFKEEPTGRVRDLWIVGTESDKQNLWDKLYPDDPAIAGESRRVFDEAGFDALFGVPP